MLRSLAGARVALFEGTTLCGPTHLLVRSPNYFLSHLHRFVRSVSFCSVQIRKLFKFENCSNLKIALIQKIFGFENF
jgi:hypothetical protein